jgi:hypothetical protein
VSAEDVDENEGHEETERAVDPAQKKRAGTVKGQIIDVPEIENQGGEKKGLFLGCEHVVNPLCVACHPIIFQGNRLRQAPGLLDSLPAPW